VERKYDGEYCQVHIDLSKGMDCEAKSYLVGSTPLHRAACNGHDAVVNMLLEKGADIEAEGYGQPRLNPHSGHGFTALHWAALPQHMEYFTLSAAPNTQLWRQSAGHNIDRTYRLQIS